MIRPSVLSQLSYKFWIFKYCKNLVEFIGRILGLRKDPDYTWIHWQYKIWRYISTCLGFEPTIWVFEWSKRTLVIRRTAAVTAISFQIQTKLVLACNTSVTSFQCKSTALCSVFNEKFYKGTRTETGYKDPSSSENCLVKEKAIRCPQNIISCGAIWHSLNLFFHYFLEFFLPSLIFYDVVLLYRKAKRIATWKCCSS